MTAYPVTLDTADLATIRAALWLYHEEGMGEPDNRCDHVQSLAVNEAGEECISLDNAAVWALFERLRPDALKAASPGADYLDRFPPEHRESADRAYQDGFADGANNAGDDGEESEGEAVRAGLEADAAAFEREGDPAMAAECRRWIAQSASPDPEGQSAPALRLFYIAADTPDGENLDAFSWGATEQEAVDLWFDLHNPNNDTAERPRVFECPTTADKPGPVAWEEIRSWEH